MPMLTGTEGADAKRKLHGCQAVDSPVAGGGLGAWPAPTCLPRPCHICGSSWGCWIFMGSPPFMETDKTPAVASSQPGFLILQACCFQFLGSAAHRK